MNKYTVHRLKEYLRYVSRSQSINSIHSPFVFDFYNEVIKKRYKNKKIEDLRKSLYKNDNSILVEDLGAGSVSGPTSRKRKISGIAKNAVKPPIYASILHNIVAHYKPADVVEMGTSLGITSLYLQQATSNPIYTLEGSKNVLEIAEENFSHFKEPKPISVLGNFDSTFAEVFSKISNPYLVYIDGNHTYEATMRYFNLILENPEEKSIIIFDDIYWSPDMTRAWQAIKNNPTINLSIDLYQLGIVFFNSDFKEKQNFTLPVRHIRG